MLVSSVQQGESKFIDYIPFKVKSLKRRMEKKIRRMKFLLFIFKH